MKTKPVFLIFFCTVVAAPLLMLLQSWFNIDADLWNHLYQTQLFELVFNSLALTATVVTMVALVAVPLAWLTACCQFPFSRYFSWLLILPMAMPAYVLAFVFLGALDFASPLQQILRAWGLIDYFDPRHFLVLSLVLTCALYPYSYLLLRTAFMQNSTMQFQVARSLGVKPWLIFFKVIIPSVKPIIIAGSVLVAMEVLADFGAVSIFGYNSFTTAIYKSWQDFFSLETAAQLSSLLLMLAMVILVIKQNNSQQLMTQGKTKNPRHGTSMVLQGVRKWLAFGFCLLVFVIALVLPLMHLVSWVIATEWIAGTDLTWARLAGDSFVLLIWHTLTLAFIASVLVVLCALAIGLFIHKTSSGDQPLSSNRKYGYLIEFAGIGYALPGSVLAVGVMLLFTVFDSLQAKLFGYFGSVTSYAVLGSMLGLYVAYLIRFVRPAITAITGGLNQLQEQHQNSAMLLGASAWHRFRLLTIPLLTPAILTALLLVFVDVAKEMPATLLLRPTGWDTLAVKIFELTSEGEWHKAALPASLLVLLSLLPVWLLIRHSLFKPVKTKHH